MTPTLYADNAAGGLCQHAEPRLQSQNASLLLLASQIRKLALSLGSPLESPGEL